MPQPTKPAREKATPALLAHWQQTLASVKSLDESLVTVLRSYDFSDVFKTKDDLFNFCEQLKQNDRVPFVSCLDVHLLKALLVNYPLLNFFQAWLTPAQSIDFLKLLKFDYFELAIDSDPEPLADWFNWFAGYWDKLPAFSFYSIIDMIEKGATVSDFLVFFKGDASALFQHTKLALRISMHANYPALFGDIDLVLQRLAQNSDIQEILFKNLFIMYETYQAQCPDEYMINLIQKIDLRALLIIVSASRHLKLPWIEAIKKRVLSQTEAALLPLKQDDWFFNYQLESWLSTLINERLQFLQTGQKKEPAIPPLAPFECSPDTFSERFYNEYSACPSYVQQLWMDAQDSKHIKAICENAPESIQMFFRRLSLSDQDRPLLRHRLLQDLTSTPRTLAYFINAYQVVKVPGIRDQETLKKGK